MRTIASLALLVLCLEAGVAQTTLTVVFDEASPPFSTGTTAQNGEKAVSGLFPDIVDLLATQWPSVTVVKLAVPWARAQVMVERGDADAFLTYPSVARREYSVFSNRPLFTEDIGYLIFPKGSPKTAALRGARSFQDLEGLRLNVTVGSEWEQDNLPPSIARVTSVSDSLKLSVLVRRGDGDFTIMGLEQLAWWARSLGLSDKFEWQKVSFLPDSEVPFHFGIRKTSPAAAPLLALTNKALQTPAFQKALADLLARYRL